MSRVEQQDDGHWAEVYDHLPADCRGCGRPLAAPNVSLGTVQCATHGPQRSKRCRACGLVHVDHDCVDLGETGLGTPYFGAPAGQHGPTLDVGEG